MYRHWWRPICGRTAGLISRAESSRAVVGAEEMSLRSIYNLRSPVDRRWIAGFALLRAWDALRVAEWLRLARGCRVCSSSNRSRRPQVIFKVSWHLLWHGCEERGACLGFPSFIQSATETHFALLAHETASRLLGDWRGLRT